MSEHIRKHLDLGCGSKPRNPYQYEKVYGIDLQKSCDDQNVEIGIANLSLEKIPYPDNFFDSVSGFDFIEHIPRVLLTADGKSTRFPFIELMNEIWRVLKPNGFFYAVTPAYPHLEAFQDPTHVNFITQKTHEYFCEDMLYGKNYGFNGLFREVRVEWVHMRYSNLAKISLRKRYSSFKRSLFKAKKSYLLWELAAVK